ncbi:hypothetical protein [Streptomyces massasporeus]|uniref:hypothetical protein n=1 Tax=Streptomyces massasporeus TaxID=67324 RepID=UPI00198AB392|nr:hypothetical protein [Streptomyces massasporeus]GGV83143.1 hypothetical protein GCM10010228_59020 [Streptomyces massasporeus]
MAPQALRDIELPDLGAEIERHTPAGSTAVDEFFRLLEHFRRDATKKPALQDPADRLPGIEYMTNTIVTLFWRRRLLTQAVQRLEDRDFRVVHLAARGWTTERDMHQAVAAALQFPAYLRPQPGRAQRLPR